MKQFFILLVLSILFTLLLKYLPRSFKSLNNSREYNYCEQLKQGKYTAFRDLLNNLYDESGMHIEIAKNIDKISCYLGYIGKQYRYEDKISLLLRLTKLAETSLEKNLLTNKLSKIINEKNVQDLYIAVSLFYKKYKRYPRDLMELVEKGFLNELPKDPYGGQYYIDENGKIMRILGEHS